MPITPVSASGIILGNLVSTGVAGPNNVQLANGLGNGIATYLTSVVTSATLDIGILGVGQGTGTVVLTPATAIPAFSSGFAAAGMTGNMIPALSTALGISLCTILATATISVPSPTVGIGVGAGVLVPVGAIPFILTGLASSGLTGTAIPQYATAVGNAIDTCLPSAIVGVVITGSGSFIPSAMVGTGKLL
jgi:hypothetical protein